MARVVDPCEAGKNTEWFVMYRAASEIEELSEIARTPYGLVTEQQAQTWADHPLSCLGLENINHLDAVTAWLDTQAVRVRQEMAE